MSSLDTFSHDGEAVERSSDRPFDENYMGYTSFDAGNVDVSREHEQPPPPTYGSGGGRFPGDEVTVEYEPADSLYGFDSSSTGAGGNRNFLQSPFAEPIPVSNGNGKPYDLGVVEDGVFSVDGPVLPPPDEMGEQGSALREWRRCEI